ncbi:MAG: hypothetical protein EAZ42_00560 [Verrucomicrobia bacterium]|nr:MAG: hypothetical protein EAZ42_00560 [Verrucomicrobiota bacterium]
MEGTFPPKISISAFSNFAQPFPLILGNAVIKREYEAGQSDRGRSETVTQPVSLGKRGRWNAQVG